jgi:hypothetical protein
VLEFDEGAGVLRVEYSMENQQLVLSSSGSQLAFVRAPAGTAVGSPPAKRAPSVVVNRTKLRDQDIRKLESQFNVRMLDGKYWYDAACGAWGLEGGPCLGFLPAKLVLGGALSADASGGGTGVFINGRELHPVDVGALQRITPVQPGRYWLNERGDCGYEGNPIAVVNLVQLANASRAASGSYHSRSDITGIGSGGNGSTSYVMGKDWSVVIGE